MAVQSFANADSDSSGQLAYGEPPAVAVNEGSNASFDKRLPPVLPGEVVNDGHSRSKVWSTAGSVSSGSAPQAPQVPNTGDNFRYNGNSPVVGGVIVDQRDRRDQRGR